MEHRPMTVSIAPSGAPGAPRTFSLAGLAARFE